MEGWKVVGSDDHKIGTVVRVEGDFYIVEQGALMKHRHAIPKDFVHVREAEQEICLSLSKELVHDSPRVGKDGTFDRDAVAAHYGLAEAEPAPETEGYGDVEGDETAVSAERDMLSAGMKPGPQLRAEIREGSHTGTDSMARPVLPPGTDYERAGRDSDAS